ncbi:hypothetical protein [Solwaraspora sp. WMMD792]|uniref:hypothetical protein n=1 Tax=Solwaraspora sp. WMMD792 TaxID=3016099 RepID=UPI002417642D|nr:hypothetical protein [Solwaraspora sp. WMMD792]MDG4771834.1 hypothetical protein [Solwaraspora sp. WMMD792]
MTPKGRTMTRTHTEEPRAGSAALLPAALVLAGAMLSLVGWSWDIQWHTDVGPDTFFTMPHLLLYSGSALCGITALVVVLRTTAAQRSGRPIDPAIGGRSVRVLHGAFAAPLGYLIVGLATATFLLYGLWDQWWHSLYGFDAQLNSPPHIGLLQGNFATIIGSMVTFAAARHERWGRAGVYISLAMLVAFAPVLADAFQQAGGPVDLVAVCIACLTVLTLVTATVLVRRPGAALSVAVTLAAIQLLLWLITPWATSTYADAVGLPMRDFTSPQPVMPSWIPLSTVGAALLVELAWLIARARRVSAKPVLPLFAAVGAGLLAVLIPLQQAVLFGVQLPGFVEIVVYIAPTVLVAAAVGAATGILARRVGQMLRLLDTSALGVAA